MNEANPAISPATAVTPELLRRVEDLYDAGMMLQAYNACLSAGPINQWKSSAGRILAARVARNIGAPRLGFTLIRRAYHDDPENPQTRYYRAGEVLSERGPFAAWEFMRPFGLLNDADSTTRADWLAWLAEMSWTFRDFDAADSYLARADSIAGPSPWRWVMRARCLEAQDRYDEALDVSKKSLESRPWYRPGIQITAHILQILDRDDEAHDLLAEACRNIENGPVAWQLSALQLDLRRYEAACETIELAERLMPLLEPRGAKALTALKSDATYHRGDYATAIDLAKKSGSRFHINIASRLAAAAPDARRVRLDVPFVRQHHMTCAPATLSAISRVWSMPIEHLAVVEAICYDGTPAHSERRWAIDHGWTTREFTVTWDAAVALIDRGIPFTLTTTEESTGHIQAVIGYDQRRGTLLVRDPYRYFESEFDAEPLFKRYAAHGPRGMAMVPAARADLFDGLDLPDGQMYERMFQLLSALDRHDRPAALAAWESMNASDVEHRLTLWGKLSIAYYDGDPSAQFEIVERLLARFPDDARLKFSRLQLLRSIGQRDQRLEMLEEICRKGPYNPIFENELASELSADARQNDRSIRLLRKALRRHPQSGHSLHTLAGRYWSQLHREPALELYRYAACVDDKNENAAQSYFIASRHLRQTDQALQMLKSRFDRFGTRSSFPGRTYAWALEALARTTEAMNVLDEAQRRRPDDGELILYCADAHARHGAAEKSRSLLRAASGKANHMNWLRAAAMLATLGGNRAEALAQWREILAIQPIAVDAHESVARLLAETESTDAALAHLEAACAKFPSSLPLAQIRIGWLRRENTEAAEPAVRALVEQRPRDAWARRELAIVLMELRRFEEALSEAAAGLNIEPTSAISHHINAMALIRLNRAEEARKSWQEAIRLTVDYQYAISEYVGSFETNEQRRQALKFVKSELERQVIFGDGIFAYVQQASDTLKPDELLQDLREALAVRPDLWHCWSAVINQLSVVGKLDEALDLARQASNRYALIPRIWLDMAYVCRMRGDRAAEIDALTECLRIAPGWSTASRQLASALVRDGSLPRARKVMREAIAREPLDAANYSYLAELLWRMNKRHAAVVRVKQAVIFEPGLQNAWDLLRRWTSILKRPDEAAKLARQLTERRAGEARSWMVLARTLSGDDTLEERLAACDKALALNPRFVDAADMKAAILCRANRFDEAMAACELPIFGNDPPVPLEGRAAWILAQQDKRNAAIQRMTKILAKEPGYYWGWQMLCTWQSETKDNARYLDAAGEMVKNFPTDAVSLNWLADAQLRSGQRKAGKASFARVLVISPDNEFAAVKLFDAQLADKEFDDASKTLDLLLRHHDSNEARQRQIALNAKKGDAELAAKQFADASKWVLTDTASFNNAIRAMDQANLKAQVDDVLAKSVQALASDENSSLTGRTHLAEISVERAASVYNFKKCEQILSNVKARPELWCAAVVPYLNTLAAQKEKIAIRRLIRANRDLLRSDARTWGTVGYALLTVAKSNGDRKKVIDWMSDYSGRKDVRPWMLVNLASTLRRLKKYDEAYRVSEYAIKLTWDNTIDRHIIWLAIEEMLTQRRLEGARRFQKIDPRHLPQVHHFLAILARMIFDFDLALFQSKKSAMTTARAGLKAARAANPGYSKNPELQRTYRRAVRYVARRVGGPIAWIWAYSQF